MQENTRSQKATLVLGLKKNVTKRRSSNIEEVVEGVGTSVEGGFRGEPLIEVSPVNTQLTEGNIPSLLSEELVEEPNRTREESSVSIRESSEGGLQNTMDPLGGGGIPPPILSILPIDPLVRPRGVPIIVPQGLPSLDIPSNLPKFYGTKDEDPSRHMERFVERVICSLITNQQYWLVWFPTTLDGETYEWYRDHDEGHF